MPTCTSTDDNAQVAAAQPGLATRESLKQAEVHVANLDCQCPRPRDFTKVWYSEDAMGGVEKRGGWKTSRMTPLPKRGFGPPLVRYVFHPPHVSVLCFSCTKIHDRADQKLFWRGPKIFGRARSLVRFPPPIRFAPPHITAQGTLRVGAARLPCALCDSFSQLLDQQARGPSNKA